GQLAAARQPAQVTARDLLAEQAGRAPGAPNRCGFRCGSWAGGPAGADRQRREGEKGRGQGRAHARGPSRTALRCSIKGPVGVFIVPPPPASRNKKAYGRRARRRIVTAPAAHLSGPSAGRYNALGPGRAAAPRAPIAASGLEALTPGFQEKRLR